MRKPSLALKAAICFFAVAGVTVLAVTEIRGRWREFHPSLPRVDCDRLASNFTLETVAELPEPVSCMVADNGGPNSMLLYVGTRGDAGVYRVGPRKPYSQAPVILSMGDLPSFGTASVAALAWKDFDRDGREDLIALSSQESPRGKPKAYLLSPHLGAHLIATADIASSWPHGAAFVRDVFGRPTFLSAFCGHGEVVEFRLFERKSNAGFHSRGLESRQIGTMSASGEQIASTELMGAGTCVLVARGFKFNAAAIEVFARDRSPPRPRAPKSALGFGWTRKLEFREDDRFGNVRFVVGKTRKGIRDLYAWWCVGLADGDSEFVHYRINAGGVVERRALPLGPAHDHWPDETRAALVDSDGDGVDELFYSARSGKLWRMDLGMDGPSPETPNTPTLVGEFLGGGGPIVAGPHERNGVRPLFVGVANYIVKLTSTPVSRIASESDDESDIPLDF